MLVPKLIIKYEDLITSKELIIKQIKEFFNENFGIKINNYNEKLVNILETTDFKYM